MKAVQSLLFVACGSALAVLPAAAVAEVCDKIRPGWSPSDGAAGQLDEAAFAAQLLLTTPPGWLLIALLAASLYFRRRWIDLLGAAAFLLAALALAADWWLDDPTGLNAAAFAEGCRTAPILPVALLGLLCLGMALRGFARK